MKWMDRPSVTEMERGVIYEMDRVNLHHSVVAVHAKVVGVTKNIYLDL